MIVDHVDGREMNRTSPPANTNDESEFKLNEFTILYH